MRAFCSFFFVTACLFAATLMSLAPTTGHAAETAIPLGVGPAVTVPGTMGEPVILTRLMASHSVVTPGQTLDIAWRFDLKPHWHVYWENPGDSGLPATLALGGSKLPLAFPTPKVISIPPVTNYGYENGVTLYARLPLSSHMAPGPHTLALEGKFLYCNDVCMPATVSLTLPVFVQDTAVANKIFPAQPAEPPLLDGVQAQLGSQTIELALPQNLRGSEARFYPLDEGTLDDSAPQPLNVQTNPQTLTLARDTQAPETPTRLRGLLVLDGTAYRVDVPVATGGIHAALPAGAQGPGTPTDTGPGMAKATLPGLGVALFMALCAGFILNLMPCVLPVLSLKFLSLATHHRAANRTTHLLAYSLGVLVSFWGFAFAIALLKVGGAQLGWGFHLQSPLFVAALCMLMLVLALMFFGVASVGESFSRFGVKPGTSSGKILESAATGVLAVVVATPCTVPFMGSAMAFALTQPLPASLAVFTALGFGMALPFLLAIPYPRLMNWLPKPGRWMETFRHMLGWPMLATALWLLTVFANQTDMHATLLLLTLLLGIAFALWLKGTWPSTLTRLLALLALVATFGVLALRTAPDSTMLWQPWSPAALAEARAQNVPVFVDFTADWCVTCKVNELSTLNTHAVQALFAQNHTILLKADWTKADPEITAELGHHGRQGVPLYLLYKPGSDTPEVLPQILTPGLLERALDL